MKRQGRQQRRSAAGGYAPRRQRSSVRMPRMPRSADPARASAAARAPLLADTPPPPAHACVRQRAQERYVRRKRIQKRRKKAPDAGVPQAEETLRREIAHRLIQNLRSVESATVAQAHREATFFQRVYNAQPRCA